MEGMNEKRKQLTLPLFEEKTIADNGELISSPFYVSETKRESLDKSIDREHPVYFSKLAELKKRLDSDNNSSDSTGTYTAMHSMLDFFIKNYDEIDEVTEVRLLTVLHAKALDYYNTHRGTRFSIQGRYRKNIAVDMMGSIQDAILNELNDSMRLEALNQLISRDVPPVIFDNEPEYKTDVSSNSEVLTEFFTNLAKKDYMDNIRRNATTISTENGKTITKCTMSEKQIEEDANNNSLICVDTYRLSILRQLFLQRNECAQRSIPKDEKCTYSEYLDRSIYRAMNDAPRIAHAICKNYMIGRDGQPVREQDRAIRDENERNLRLLVSKDPEDHVKLLNMAMKRIMEYEVPDTRIFLNPAISKADKMAFIEKNYKEIREVTIFATIFQNLLRTTEEDAAINETEEHRLFFAQYSPEFIDKFNKKWDFMTKYAITIDAVMGEFGYSGHALEGVISDEDIDVIVERSAININMIYNGVNFDQISRPEYIEQNTVEYINNLAQNMETSGLRAFLNKEINEEAINAYTLLKKEREGFANEEIAKQPIIMEKLDSLRDENLIKAVKLLMFNDKDNYKILLDALSTRNEGQISKNLAGLFDDFMKLSTQSAAYSNADASKLLKLQDYSEAIKLFCTSPVVNSWLDLSYRDVLLKKTDFVSSISQVMLSVYEDKAANITNSAKDKKDAKDMLYKGLDKYVLIMNEVEALEGENIDDIALKGETFEFKKVIYLKSEEEIEQSIEQDMKKLDKEDEYAKLKLPLYNIETNKPDTIVSAEIKDLFNDENAILKLNYEQKRIDNAFKRFSSGDCIMHGKYPLPSIDRCLTILDKGNSVEKFALMISLQSVLKQGDKVIKASRDKKLFESRSLDFVPGTMNKLEEISDRLSRDLFYRDRSDENASDEKFVELARLNSAFYFFANRELNDEVASNLHKMGKNLDNASYHEKYTAYVEAAAKGHDLGLEIMKDNAEAYSDSNFYVEAQIRKVGKIIKNNNVFQYDAKNTQMLGAKNTEDAITKFHNGYAPDEMEKVKTQFHDSFDDYISDTIQSYTEAGLLADKIGLKLRKAYDDIAAITDYSKKHNEDPNSLKNLITDILDRLIKVSAIDKNNNHSEEYRELYTRLQFNASKYIKTHNPKTKDGKRRLALTTDLLKDLLENNWIKEVEDWGFETIYREDISHAKIADELRIEIDKRNKMSEEGNEYRKENKNVFDKQYKVFSGGNDYMKIQYFSQNGFDKELIIDENHKNPEEVDKSAHLLHDGENEGIFANDSDRKQLRFVNELIKTCRELYDISFATPDFLEALSSVNEYITADTYDKQQAAIKTMMDSISNYCKVHAKDKDTSISSLELYEHMSKLEGLLNTHFNGALEIPQEELDAALAVKKGPKSGKFGHTLSVKDLVLFPHEPSVNDIKQRTTSDCYMMAALASIAYSNPDFIRNSMRDNGNGTVTVRFFDPKNDFAPQYITVKKNIVKIEWLVTKNAVDSLWVQMIEKAFAVLYGNIKIQDDYKEKDKVDNKERSYAALDYKDSYQFLRRFMGPEYDGSQQNIINLNINEDYRKYEDEEFKDIEQMQPALSNKYSGIATRLFNNFEERLTIKKEIMTVGIDKDSKHIKTAEDRGFHIAHAYSVLKVFEVDGRKFIRLRDPYAAFTVGYDEEFTKSVNTGNKTNIWSTDTMGAFDMEWNDFLNTFTTLVGCNNDNMINLRPKAYQEYVARIKNQTSINTTAPRQKVNEENKKSVEPKNKDELNMDDVEVIDMGMETKKPKKTTPKEDELKMDDIEVLDMGMETKQTDQKEDELNMDDVEVLDMGMETKKIKDEM